MASDAVGTCIKCYIHACPPHSDRISKSQFWCFICLQQLTLDAAGVPRAEGEGEEEEPEQLAALLSEEDIQGLLGQLELEAEITRQHAMAFAAETEGMRRAPLGERERELIGLAFALAVRNLRVGGGMTATAPRMIEDRQLVNPRLWQHFGL
ncbi:MAG: hypothetical protein LC799_19680 [Actinobacteria bacterium]|nr:hypothetical protein [Actinomycetota bacterium]